MRFTQPVFLFDLGETLFQPLPDQYGRRNRERFIPQVNRTIKNDELHASFNKAKHRVAARFAKRSFYLHKELVGAVFRTTCQLLELRVSSESIAHYCEAQRLAVIEHLRPREDCMSTLSSLAQEGKQLGIVSNIDNDWLVPLVDKWQLDDYVEFILSSESACSCKPDPRIFSQSCSIAGVQAKNVVFVGDDEVNDIQGGNQAGLTTVRLMDKRGSSGTEADHQINNLAELLE